MHADVSSSEADLLIPGLFEERFDADGEAEKRRLLLSVSQPFP